VIKSAAHKAKKENAGFRRIESKRVNVEGTPNFGYVFEGNRQRHFDVIHGKFLSKNQTAVKGNRR